MSNYTLLADLREWAESYDAVEIGADGVLYNAIHRIEVLEADIGALKAAFRVNMLRANASHEEIDAVIRVALGEKKDV